jgi:hypothetical protein
MPDNIMRRIVKRSVTLRKTDCLLGYKLSYGGTLGWTTQFSKMSGIVTVTGTVVNITHNGDNNFNLGDEEFDDLLIAVTKSQVMSPARKRAYARLEFLERKHAAHKATRDAVGAAKQPTREEGKANC